MRGKVQRELRKCAQHFYGVTSMVLLGCQSERPAIMGEVGVLISTGTEGVDESEVLEEDVVGVLISTGEEGVDETDMLEVDDDRAGSTGVEVVDDSEMIDEDDVRAGSTGVSEEVLKADDVEIVELEIVGAVPNCKS